MRCQRPSLNHIILTCALKKKNVSFSTLHLFERWHDIWQIKHRELTPPRDIFLKYSFFTHVSRVSADSIDYTMAGPRLWCFLFSFLGHYKFLIIIDCLTLGGTYKPLLPPLQLLQKSLKNPPKNYTKALYLIIYVNAYYCGSVVGLNVVHI